uniref:Uncharacterized protein n=1 Tax=Setaria viridis TaxID=4556 RepID=A0A4U6U6W3_SETVI|nr:hypothetical protein SEVIR_7G211201v2 [Setaria viridis]
MHRHMHMYAQAFLRPCTGADQEQAPARSVFLLDIE